MRVDIDADKVLTITSPFLLNLFITEKYRVTQQISSLFFYPGNVLLFLEKFETGTRPTTRINTRTAHAFIPRITTTVIVYVVHAAKFIGSNQNELEPFFPEKRSDKKMKWAFIS